MRVWIGLLALPLLLGLSRPAGAEDRGRQGRRGRRSFWRNQEMVEKLALTPEQIEQLEAFDDTFQVRQRELRDQTRKSREEMQDLLAAEEFPEAKAAAQAKIIADGAGARASLQTDRLIAIRGILTAEQWAELQACRERMGERWRRRAKQGGRHGRHGEGVENSEEPETTE